MTSKNSIALLIYIIFFLSLFSVSIIRLIGLDGMNISLAYPFYLLFFVTGFPAILGAKINKSGVALVGLLLLIAVSNFLVVKDVQNIKNIIYLILLVFLIVNWECVSINVLIKLVKSCFYSVLIWVCIIYVIDVVLLGNSLANFNQNMLIDKQELNLISTLYLSVLFFEKVGKKYIILVVLLLLMFGLKSALIIFLAFVAKENLKYLIVTCILFSLLIFTNSLIGGVIPSSLMPFIDFFFIGNELSASEYKKLNTLFIRFEVFRLNVLNDSIVEIVKGSGFNKAEGSQFLVQFNSSQINLPTALESGVLYLYVYFGLIGIVYFVSIVKMAFYQTGFYAYLIFGLLISNIFQDNIASLFWLIIGLFVGDYVSQVTLKSIDE